MSSNPTTPKKTKGNTIPFPVKKKPVVPERSADEVRRDFDLSYDGSDLGVGMGSETDRNDLAEKLEP